MRPRRRPNAARSGPGERPAERRAHRDDGRPGSGPVLRNAVGRLGRRRGSRRRPRGCGRRAAHRLHGPAQPAVAGRRRQGSPRHGTGAPVGRGRGRVRRRVPARRRRTVGHRAGRVAGAQSPPGVCPHDGLRAGRTPGRARRPRHQLHRPGRSPARHRHRRIAGAATESGRGLRRRRDAAGGGVAQRDPRGPPVGGGSGARRGDGRRRRDADGAVLRDGRRWHLARPPRGQSARRRGPLLRHLRHGRRRPRRRRRDGTKVLRRTVRSPRRRRAPG